MNHTLKPLLRIINNVNKSIIIPKRSLLKHSINHITNKKVLDRYLRLPLPCNKVLATYIWIDGSGINLRSKDRVLNCVPCCPEVTPEWAFDGSSTGQATLEKSDTTLKPVAVYRDPFRCDPHVLVLCDVYNSDGSPVPTNHRKFCKNLCEIHRDEEPWFGLEQECLMLDVDGWGLGWPKGGGFPAVIYQYSYCGVGAKYMAGRDISDAHKMACLYAGLDYGGSNAEVMFGSWEWQIGTSIGIKAADDMWISRYIMGRVAEEYGVDITYHPKPMGSMHPGVGMHHNFSTIRMRSEGGYQYIEECIKKLEANHMKHMKKYGNDECTNRMRLSGKFETAPFDKFSWGVASRKGSIRLTKETKETGRGFLEDRRPAADCDPYLTCGLLLETCLGTKALAPPSKPEGKSSGACALACASATSESKPSTTCLSGSSTCLSSPSLPAIYTRYATLEHPATAIFPASLNDSATSTIPVSPNDPATSTQPTKSNFPDISTLQPTTSISQPKSEFLRTSTSRIRIFPGSLTTKPKLTRSLHISVEKNK